MNRCRGCQDPVDLDRGLCPRCAKGKMLEELHNMDIEKAHMAMAKVMEETGITLCPFCMCVNLEDFKSKSPT